MDQTSLSILMYIGGLVMVLLLAKIFFKPLKIILKLCLSSVLGCLVILLINTFSSFIGISIGINPVTALICGVLGLPGVALLVLIQILL